MVAKKTSKHISQKSIFFLRHNNDIDHMVPVIYKWLETEKIPTGVIITTKKNLLQDYRINYLRQFKNVNIYHINDLFKKYSKPYFFNIFYFKYDTECDNFFEKIPFLRKIADGIIKRIAEKIYKGIDEGFVAFDWISTHFVNEMVKLAKEKELTTISLPHGDRPYVSHLEGINFLNYDCLASQEPSKIYDYVVVPNRLCFERYENYLENNKIKILGSPRYCDEWLNIILKMIPTYKVDESKDKYKIVFFLRNIDYPIFWDEVVRTIKLILQFEKVYLIIKHHPRNSNAKRLTKKLINIYPEVEKNIDVNLKFIYGNINSVSLIKWADLIIDIGTSVTWDAVKQNKPVLMPEYLYANYSTIAHYIKKSEIKCRDQLFDMLEQLIRNKNYKFYNEAEKRKFIREVIDVPDKYVLERYVKFLKACFKN